MIYFKNDLTIVQENNTVLSALNTYTLDDDINI